MATDQKIEEITLVKVHDGGSIIKKHYLDSQLCNSNIKLDSSIVKSEDKSFDKSFNKSMCKTQDEAFENNNELK